MPGSGRLGGAQGDWFQLGFARITFLVGTLGPLALVRLTAGILLAIAPLIAGLMLFGITRPIFVGWVRGLVMTFLASLALTLFLGAQLAVLEPWLMDALAKRGADQQTLEAPVEILAVTLTFAITCLGGLAIFARIAFHPSALVGNVLQPRQELRDAEPAAGRVASSGDAASDSRSRATAVALSVSESMRREGRMMDVMRPAGSPRTESETATGSRATGKIEMTDTLGSSYRRNTRRISAAGARRDQAR